MTTFNFFFCLFVWLSMPFARSAIEGIKLVKRMLDKGYSSQSPSKEFNEELWRRMRQHPIIGERATRAFARKAPFKQAWTFWMTLAWPLYWDDRTENYAVVSDIVLDMMSPHSTYTPASEE